jgi:acetyltransferase-like isoleucine patch superfamily enzyme
VPNGVEAPPDSRFHPAAPDVPVRSAPVYIGHNVWIGTNSIILAGASIGDHSVIAAGSVVAGDIPGRAVAGGAPARVIRGDRFAGWVGGSGRDHLR